MNKHLKSFLDTLRRTNWLMVVCMVGLLLIGVLFIKSANATREELVLQQLYMKQIKHWIVAGLMAYIFFAKLHYKRIIEFSALPYAGALFLLVLVLVIGTVRFGARRWLFGFQPSEFAKLVIIPALTYVLCGNFIERGFLRFVAASAVALIPTLLILKQPDLGTALVIVPTTAAMLYVSGCAQKAFLRLATVGFVAVCLFVGAIILPEALPVSPETKVKLSLATDKVIHKHWKDRVLTFVYPERDPLGAGWNKTQSEIAVGSGGKWGKGYQNGTQNILGFLPKSVSATDFIFSVIAEETGFAGACLMLILYIGLFGSIGYIAFQCADSEARLLCVGVGTLLFIHVFINVAMTVGRMPITGLPLPLIGYGGSFTISTMAMLGIVQSVAVNGKRVEKN
jgi:rod shape determining protein RodA